ncbi:MAG: DNA polymerase Y family protein [Planctomycetia bacterium]|nr:DNA polymerase Y family protein [Planctomycetia bacterium]
MPRFMTIWLPRWPVQRRLLQKPELRRVPVFVCRRERRGAMTVASWAWAEPPPAEQRKDITSGRGARATIPPGMSLAEAMAVLAIAHGSRACHVAEVQPDDPAADRESLERLARWCRRFSPVVGIEEAADGSPECLHLDVTGTAGFFGGEESLVRTAVWTLAARGLHGRAAIADTPAAAWAAAHHTDSVAPPGGAAPPLVVRRAAGGASPGVRLASRRRRRWAVVPRGEAATLLAGLPVAALRIDAATTAALAEVGIDTIGGVLALSARSLAARFPPLLSRRLAEFRGMVSEPIVPPGGEALPLESHSFDFPLRTADIDEQQLIDLIERLLGRCLTPLVARGEGVLAVQLRLEQAARTTAAAPTVIDVGLFRPTASLSHLVELVRLRLTRQRLPVELDGVAVEVVAAGTVSCRQRLLFGGGVGGLESADADAEVAMLLDRLAGRLGRAAVFEPQSVGDAQPEHAWIATPAGDTRPAAGDDRPSPRDDRPSRLVRDRVSRPSRMVRRSAPSRAMPSGRRPIWMPPRPVPLDGPEGEMVAVAPDGPPARFRFGDVLHHIVQAYGPERIETAWWRGPTVRRDYYVVETESGERLWVFRRLQDGGWFLHGMFA